MPKKTDPSVEAKWQIELQKKDVHIRNLEAFILQRDREIEVLRAGLADPGLVAASLERTRPFWTPPPAPPEPPPVPEPMPPPPPPPRRTLGQWLFKKVVDEHWMRIGILNQYEPRTLAWDRFPAPRLHEAELPTVAVATPSFNQGPFLEACMLSVLDQGYPKLRYAVQDGGSTDLSRDILARHAGRLAHGESVRDKGQGDAIVKAFERLVPGLKSDDAMAYLNSDDLLAPGSMRYVAEYLARHPSVDAVYGHRIIIDDRSREIGRWVLPPHDPRALEWIDYVPQETLFWRKRSWDQVGGLDPTFQFALDWDLLARFTQARLKIVRLPRFLACFRVHDEQKTSLHINTTGAEEMARVRARFHGEHQGDGERIALWDRRVRLRGALTSRLLDSGIRI